MAQIELFNLIFQEILKISPNVLYKYTLIQDQIIYLIFIPHVVLFLFLWSFGQIVVPSLGGAGHSGLRYLVVAAAYIFIVYQGWYGTFLIPLLQTWFTMMLIFGLFLFLVTRFFHPYTARKMGRGLGGAVGQSIGKQLGKGKAVEELEERLKFVRKQINDLKGRRAGNPSAEYQYNRYIEEEEELKKAIKKLGG